MLVVIASGAGQQPPSFRTERSEAEKSVKRFNATLKKDFSAPLPMKNR